MGNMEMFQTCGCREKEKELPRNRNTTRSIVCRVIGDHMVVYVCLPVVTPSWPSAPECGHGEWQSGACLAVGFGRRVR